MADSRLRHYFEPSAIIALLKREEVAGEQRWWHCVQLMEHARAGNSVIVTSALTYAEVTGGKGKSQGIVVQSGYQSVRDVVRAFFENDYVEIVEVGRIVGELAQQLIWDFPTLNSFDATHLASALHAECAVLFTYDRDLLKLTDPAGNFTITNRTVVSGEMKPLTIRITPPTWDEDVHVEVSDSPASD